MQTKWLGLHRHRTRAASGDGEIGKIITAQPKTDFLLSAKKIQPEDLADAEIRSIAMILEKRWKKMEPDASVWKYTEELEWIRKNGHTPVWVAEIDGVIGAALIAQRVNIIPDKYDSLIGVDDADGKTMICRRITTDPDDTRFNKAPRMLITEDALSYAKELHSEGRLSELIAYSRFANYKEFLETHGDTTPEIYLKTTCREDWKTEQALEMMYAYPMWLMNRWGTQGNLGLFLNEMKRRHVDSTIGMHLGFGANVHRLMPGACPEDAHACGFGVLMSYTHLLSGKEPVDTALFG
jgi:hypothetical protein